ncbi:hypothetical protein [Luteimonas saliphila]|uniref:hypothetical protein n=1 Tax=Luteimonas saliphila TaxID=2804919 RepID=UPI00192E0A7F|nr:hypothetical protein [Luteimonas saliphila]
MDDMRPQWGLCLAIAVSLVLAACGGTREGDAESGDEPAAAGGDAAPAAADGSAALRCPPKVRAELSGPDIIGIRIGMSADEALATTRCALGEDADVKAGDRWLERVETHGVELGTQTFTVRKGEHRPCNFQREWQECEGGLKWEHVDEIVTVATPGAPGKETALGVWRTQTFREGAMPPVQALLDALASKYGPPQITETSDKPRGYAAGHRDLEWVFDRAGHPLAEANPMFSRCRGAVHAYKGNTSARWNDGCGLNIRARVLPSGNNPGLAMELGSAMLHQGELFAQVEAMQAELQQLGQARRESEVQQAQEAGDVRL